MSGPKSKTWVTYLGVFIVFASLCLPAITLRSTLPSIHILDICLPLMFGFVWMNRSQLANGYGAWIPFVFSGFVLFSIVIQGHHTSTSDYFEVYKWIKFGLAIWFFSLLDYSLFKRFIPWIFGVLVVINTIHFLEFNSLNKVLQDYYNGGLQIQYFGKDSLGAPAVKRLVGTMGNPNINALLFGFFSLYYFPTNVNRKNLGLFFVSLLFVFLCQSRTALLFIFCIFAFLAIFKTRIWTKKQWLLVVFGTICTFFIAWMLATSFFQFTSYNNSLLDGTAFHSGSARGRLETWNMLGKMITEEPLFGHGPYKEFFYQNKIYSENEYILMTWRYGILGLLIYLSIFLIPFKKLVSSENEIPLKGSLMLIMMLVSAITNNPLTERNIELLFCIGIAWIFQRHQTKESMLKSKSLLLIGGSKGNAHLRNYHHLVADCFHEVLIVTNQEIDYEAFRVLNFGLKNPYKLYKSIREMRRIILDFNPDIIHVHQANAYGFITLFANNIGKPTVLTTWGSDVLTLPKRSLFDKWMVKYSLRKASEITADAQFMADAIHSLVGNVPVTIANFGVEIQSIEEGAERKNVIYSNRMHEPLYQIDQIICQLADFLSKNDDWKLHIAASGSQTEKLKQLAQEKLPKGSFQFLGFQAGKDNQQNYFTSRIYVSIPTTDGTSISLLESLAYGCLPIVSDLPANKEWIEDGVNGIISTGDLSKDVVRLLQMDAPSVQERNKTIINQKATKDSNRKKFLAIYEAIFSGAAFKA